MVPINQMISLLKIDENSLILAILKKSTTFKYNNIYSRKCPFVKIISGSLLTAKKEHKVSFL